MPLAAQPGIAADRFAREIDGILGACFGALAAAECQTVRRLPITLVLDLNLRGCWFFYNLGTRHGSLA